MAHRVDIKETEANRRLDRFLFAYLREAPHPLLYKLLRKKRIKLNGARAEGAEMLQAGDYLDLYLAPSTLDELRGTYAPPPVAAPLTDIIYENAEILVVNKPAGLVAHGGDDSLLARVLWYLYEAGAYDPSAAYTPALCNRLDTNTSGLTLCGKTLHALQKYTALFANDGVEKSYLAIAQGELHGEATLEGVYKKDERTNKAKITPIIGGESEKRAVTHYKSLAVAGGFTLLRVRPITGRSHQIRAHLASIGFPLAGDKKYGGKSTPYAPAQLLHAYKLSIKNHAQCWTAPPPQGMIRFIQELGILITEEEFI
ncbi:MAG: RluA family pseudouridine synthase [Defluviitaleaceae bacterium]|nr:RluA family pseudouridine synthase [Defluviitaleaceae bacterium]MCL2275062.1 RluA family pseudouridine synthase [Defluviitaleaceae bacterium]